MLQPPRRDLPFYMYCDANAVAVGRALYQPTAVEEKNPLVAYASRQFILAERNYSTTERKCIAMVFSIKKFRHYPMCNLIYFFADHMVIKFLVYKLELRGRLSRWVLDVEKI